jgi:predicted transport protein
MTDAPGQITFETHLEGLEEPVKTAMLDLRSFVKSLGSNVIEEVRQHRVAYAKSMNFRTFLDIAPAGNSLVVTMKYGRAAPPSTATVKTVQDAEIVKKQIADAYQKIQ